MIRGGIKHFKNVVICGVQNIFEEYFEDRGTKHDFESFFLSFHEGYETFQYAYEDITNIKFSSIFLDRIFRNIYSDTDWPISCANFINDLNVQKPVIQ